MRRAGSFDRIVSSIIYIREGLPGRVERFVVNHEIYHLKDRYRRWGWFGREIRANIFCSLKDPVGLIATVWNSLNFERLGAYARTIRRVVFKM